MHPCTHGFSVLPGFRIRPLNEQSRRLLWSFGLFSLRGSQFIHLRSKTPVCAQGPDEAETSNRSTLPGRLRHPPAKVTQTPQALPSLYAAGLLSRPPLAVQPVSCPQPVSQSRFQTSVWVALPTCRSTFPKALIQAPLPPRHAEEIGFPEEAVQAEPRAMTCPRAPQIPQQASRLWCWGSVPTLPPLFSQRELCLPHAFRLAVLGVLYARGHNTTAFWFFCHQPQGGGEDGPRNGGGSLCGHRTSTRAL